MNDYDRLFRLPLLWRSLRTPCMPNSADLLIDITISEANLEGTGYDPTWLERRRAERAARVAA